MGKFEELLQPRQHDKIMAALHLRDALKAARQNAYEAVKLISDPTLGRLYQEMSRNYQEYCNYMGFESEPVFDREEYEKSERYRKILSGEIL